MSRRGRRRHRRSHDEDEERDRGSVPRRASRTGSAGASKPGSGGGAGPGLDLPSRMGNREFGRQVAVAHQAVGGAPGAGPAPAGPGGPGPVFDPRRWTELMESIALGTQNERPHQREEYQEAIATTARALLETGPGRLLANQVKDFLKSNRGRPLTLTIGAGTAAAALFADAKIPTIPVELSDDLQLTIDASGPLARGNGQLMLTLKGRF